MYIRPPGNFIFERARPFSCLQGHFNFNILISMEHNFRAPFNLNILKSMENFKGAPRLCKGHFNLNIWKSMGELLRGTKAKTRVKGGHGPRGLCIQKQVHQSLFPWEPSSIWHISVSLWHILRVNLTHPSEVGQASLETAAEPDQFWPGNF